MSETIQADGHIYWAPVSLEIDPDEVNRQLLDRYGEDDATADNAALLTGSARRLIEANTANGPAMLNIAAWGLLREPDVLDVRAIATLLYVVLDSDISVDEVVRNLAGGEPLFEEPVLLPMETKSGEATVARLRPMVEESGNTLVHESLAILWSRPENSAWFILSTYLTDLAEGHDVGERLEELAAGIEGL